MTNGGITSKHGEALLLSDDGYKKSRNAVLSIKIVTHLKHKRNTFIYYFGTVYNANVSIGVYPIPTLYTPLLPHCPWTYSVYPWICNLEILECDLDVSWQFPDLMRTFWLRKTPNLTYFYENEKKPMYLPAIPTLSKNFFRDKLPSNYQFLLSVRKLK